MTWAAVGTAAAIGAATGAGSSIIQGGDPDEIFKRALIGGAAGAVTGGIGAGAESTVAPELLSQAGPEIVNAAAVNAVPLDTVVQQAVPEVLSSAATNVGSAGIDQITPEMMNAINLGSADAIAAQGTGTQVAGTAMNVAPTPLPPAGAPAGINTVPTSPPPTSMTEADLAQMTFAETGQYPTQPLVSTPPGAMPDVPTGGSNLISEPPTNPFMEGFSSVKDFIKKNPLESAVIGYAGLTALDAFDSSEDPRKKRTYTNKYPISPNFQPSRPQPNVYQSRYAEGGITSFDDEAGVDQFAPGGAVRKERDADADFKRYSSMMNARPEVEANEEALRKPRFARDDDADTRYENALAAAMIRQKKNNARANIGSPSAKPPTPLGTINLGSPGAQRAAAGGIMGYSLGGYAAGGNPRLLKGPGDGMSDNIPAVIGNKQPARLADGEFVVPADVVSHLGNGSTDAGAKKLHQMMDRIRTDRTGKKKQAPAVNADKYLPGKKKASGGIAGYAEGGVARYNTGGPSFSDAQVASYFQGNASTPAQQAEAMSIFGVSQAQADRANALIAAGDPGIAAANAAYNASIAANPSQAAANAQFVASQQAALAAGQPTYVSTLAPKPVTPAPVNKNTTGPGGYTIPTFSDPTVAAYLRDNNITTQAQRDQVSAIFNVDPAQIARAQALIAANDPRIAEISAKYVRDIAANPAQVAQNERDVRARMDQLGLKGPIIPPIVPVPVTPESTATTGPIAGSAVYRPGFVPRATGVNTSSAALDPYSNRGLVDLYSQMMEQYNKPAAPMSDVQVKALAEEAYKSGSGAEVGRALINKGIPVNQAISALKSYSGLTPDIVNQAYIGGQSLGVAPPATLDTQYTYSDPATYYRPPAVNNTVLTKPVVDAAFKAPASTEGFFTAPNGQIFSTEAAYTASLPAPSGNKAGGLLSIKHKKRKK